MLPIVKIGYLKYPSIKAYWTKSLVVCDTAKCNFDPSVSWTQS